MSSSSSGGVTSLVAGTNISLTPSSGLGAVTVAQNYTLPLQLNSQYVYRNMGSTSAEQPVIIYGTSVTTTTSPFTFVLPVAFYDANYVFLVNTNSSSAGAIWAVSNVNSARVSLSWTGGLSTNQPFSYVAFGRGSAPP